MSQKLCHRRGWCTPATFRGRDRSTRPAPDQAASRARCVPPTKTSRSPARNSTRPGSPRTMLLTRRTCAGCRPRLRRTFATSTRTDCSPLTRRQSSGFTLPRGPPARRNSSRIRLRTWRCGAMRWLTRCRRCRPGPHGTERVRLRPLYRRPRRLGWHQETRLWGLPHRRRHRPPDRVSFRTQPGSAYIYAVVRPLFRGDRP